MAVLLKQNRDNQRQLLEQASNEPTVPQSTCKAAVSQTMAALEKLAKSLTSAQTAPSAPTEQLPNLQEGEDPTCSLITFEEVAQQAGWPELQATYQMANPSGSTPHAEGKQALLERREHHRVQLRKETLQMGDTPEALYYRVQAQLHSWLQPTKNTTEEMLDLLCLEQFLSGLPAHMQTWLKKYPGLTIQEAVTHAAAFQREQTPTHSASENVNREPSVPEPQLKCQQKRKHTESKEVPERRWRALWPSNSGDGTAQRYTCQGLDQRATACPQSQTCEGMETEDSGTVLSSAVAPLIKTFIFLDLETTGLPVHRPKVTELCLVAVHHTSLVQHTSTGHPKLPRILDKLCLIINPGRLVTPKAAEITGLNNFNLDESEKPNFDEDTVALIKNFLQRQTQPVCLVAHNGYKFDFPLLKTELRLQGQELPGCVYCLDTMQALKELDQNPGVDPSVVPGSYSLPSLYKHFFKEQPKDSHYAEGDVKSMLLLFLCKASEFLEYAGTNARLWTEVQPMYTPGMPQTP